LYLDTLSAALDAVEPAGAWSVTLGADGRVRFEASLYFEVEGVDSSQSDRSGGYGARGAGRALGLPSGGWLASEPASSAPLPARFALTAPHRHQLDAQEALYLHIEGLDAMTSTVRASGMGADGCLDVLDGRREDGAPAETRPSRCFHPPLARMRRLRVGLVDYFGRPAAFDNREHRLELVVTTSGKEVNSQRGYNPASQA
jgi:hypothetical protein